MRLRSRLLPAAVGLALAGCSAQPEPPPVVVAVVDPAPPTAAEPPPAPPAAAPAPPVPDLSPFPTDLGGKLLAKAVALPDPGSVPAERTAGPKPRPLPARLSPTADVRPGVAPVTTPPDRPVSLRPVAPRERVPLLLAATAALPADRPRLPEPPGVTARARDAAAPPAMPVLGRAKPNRASLDDPTADVANAEIVTRPVLVGVVVAAFVRAGLPDPFEFAEQVRFKVPPGTDPGVSGPVPVPPMRP